jgi:hypothetical protein
MSSSRNLFDMTAPLAGAALALVASLLVACGSPETRAKGATASTPVTGAATDPAAPPAPPAGSPAVPAVVPPAPAPPRGEDVATVVEYLLARIGESGLTFIRNGSEHTAAEAAAHIRSKYEHYRKDIKTPEDFIDKAASKSVLSGKPYLVKMPDGTTRLAADWLRGLLAEYRAQKPQAV